MTLSRRAILGGAAGTTTMALSAASLAQVPGLDADVDAAVQAALDAKACPGAAVAIGLRGATLFARDYGLANLETQTPVDGGSIFRIASLTKQFAAVAALKLASLKMLSLDDAVLEYVPAFASADRFSVRELMNHTAGLSDEGGSSQRTGDEVAISSTALAEEIAGQPKLFDFPPGTAWLYSNANYKVLGAVIERVTGLPLAAAMDELLFRPLSLTSLAFDDQRAVVPGRVSGYSATESGDGFYNADLEIAAAGAAGAMRGSAHDLVRWHDMLLSGAVLDSESRLALLTPGRLRDGRLSGANRFSPQDANYGDTQYALGVLVSPASALGPVVQHYGYIAGFSACLETYTDAGLTIAILCNGEAGPSLPFRAVRRAVLAHGQAMSTAL